MKLNRYPAVACVALAAAAAAPLLTPSGSDGSPSLTAQQVFERASPSIWRVMTYDEDNLPLAIGSAVVTAAQSMITNCHVLAKAHRVVVRHESTKLDARLAQWDVQRDVCLLRVPGADAPAVALSDSSRLSTGQNVYAIGNPKGLDLTLSSGLLSAIRRNDAGQVVLLQTSAPISGGSSGGGLFNDRAELIGITTLGSASGDIQNVNFAIPTDWILDLPRRHADARDVVRTAELSSTDATTAPMSEPNGPGLKLKP